MIKSTCNIIKTNYSKLKTNVYRMAQENNDGIITNKNKTFSTSLPCHYSSLFIKSTGEVYPCCAVWSDPKWKIGHLSDNALIEKIINYDGSGCKCFWRENRKATSYEKPVIKHLHLELSLKCQAQCAMCSVNAPGWDGSYNYYNALTQLVDYFVPEYITVQGGEILVQPKSIDWIQLIKKKHENIGFRLVTNGGAANQHALETIESLFKLVSISFVGYQSETYRTIMGLGITKTTEFAHKIANRGKVTLRLKFLVTPLNVHESALFFRWAVGVVPAVIVMHDSDISKYINYDTEDSYWFKIIDRSAKALQNAIKDSAKIINQKNIKMHIHDSVKKLYSIDSKFIDDNNLNNSFVSTLDENIG